MVQSTKMMIEKSLVISLLFVFSTFAIPTEGPLSRLSCENPLEEVGCVRCEVTCDNFGKGGGVCTKFVCPDSCVCKDPYVRDSSTNECIFVHQCKPAQSVNENCNSSREEYSEYADPYVHPTCDNYQNKEKLDLLEKFKHTFNFSPGCICKTSFVKNKKVNKCVLPKECEVSVETIKSSSSPKRKDFRFTLIDDQQVWDRK